MSLYYKTWNCLCACHAVFMIMITIVSIVISGCVNGHGKQILDVSLSAGIHRFCDLGILLWLTIWCPYFSIWLGICLSFQVLTCMKCDWMHKQWAIAACFIILTVIVSPVTPFVQWIQWNPCLVQTRDFRDAFFFLPNVGTYSELLFGWISSSFILLRALYYFLENLKKKF